MFVISFNNWNYVGLHEYSVLMSTLDEGPTKKVQQNGAILFIESYKLDPMPLN
jgi:hypothetical protein